MVEDFLHDHGLHLRVRILIHCGRVLQGEYVQMLDTHKEGQMAALSWQARRSSGAWFETVHKLSDLLHTPEILTSLGFRPHDTSAAPQSPEHDNVVTLRLLSVALQRLDEARREANVPPVDKSRLSIIETLIDDLATTEWILTRALCTV